MHRRDPDDPLRPKPWYRTRNLVLAVVAAGLVSFAQLAAWAVNAQPADVYDYPAELARLRASDPWLARTPPGDGPNGYDLVMQAARLHDDIIREFRLEYQDRLSSTAIDQATGFWTPRLTGVPDAERAAALDLVARMDRSAIPGLLAEIAATRRYERPLRGGAALDLLLPDLGNTRRFARYLGARAAIATDHGDAETMLASVEQTLAMGRHLAVEPELISRLVAVAIDGYAERIVHDALSQRDWDDATLDRIEALFAEHTERPPIGAYLPYERVFLIDTLDLVFSEKGVFLPANLPRITTVLNGQPVVNTNGLQNIGGLFMPTRAEVMRQIDEAFVLFDRLLVEMENGQDTSATRDEVNLLAKRSFFVGSFLPSFDRPATSLHNRRDAVAEVMFRLALIRYERLHGEPPPTHEALREIGYTGPLAYPTTGDSIPLDFKWPQREAYEAPNEPKPAGGAP